MTAKVTVTTKVYGTPPDWKPLTKEQWHGTKYIEWDVPEDIHKKLCKMIGKEVKKFHKKCKCESCKNDRKELKNNH